MSEGRSEPRQRTLKGGKIVIDSTSIYDCLIREMSGRGARLIVESALLIPQEFELRYGTGSERRQRGCRIVWREADRMGIVFV